MVEPPPYIHQLPSDSDRDERPRRVDKSQPGRRPSNYRGHGSIENPVDLTAEDDPPLRRPNGSSSIADRSISRKQTAVLASQLHRSIARKESIPLASPLDRSISRKKTTPLLTNNERSSRSILQTQPLQETNRIVAESRLRLSSAQLSEGSLLQKGPSDFSSNDWSSITSPPSYSSAPESRQSELESESSGTASYKRALERNEVCIPTQQLKCYSCLEQGIGCDGEQPCSTCAEPGIECEYPGRRKTAIKPKPATQISTAAKPYLLSGIASPTQMMNGTTSGKWNISKAAEDHRHQYRQTVLGGSNDSDVLESSDESEAETIPLEPQAFEKFVRSLETKLRAFQEYIVLPRLKQNKVDARQARGPKLDMTMQSPFAQPFSKAALSNLDHSSKATIQLQVKTHRKGPQGSKNKPRIITVPITKIKCDTMSLPKYKSIGRVGPSLLARNVRTSKYRPYDAADEHIEDAAITRKYNELMQRYEHNDESMKSQRKCLELVGLWTPWAEQLLKHLKIKHTDILYYYLHDVEEGWPEGWRPDADMSDTAWSAWTAEQRAACQTCKMDGDWDPSGRWKNIAKLLPVPDGRSFAAAGLASHAFHKTSHVSLWHIASTSGSVRALIQEADDKDEKKGYDGDLCAVCYVHNCPTHGRYCESDDDTHGDQEAVINDDEKEHNDRVTVSLPSIEPGERQDHLCGVYCVDRSLQISELLGRQLDGSIAGSSRQIKETRPVFHNEEFCSTNCFWNIGSRRLGKVCDLGRGNIPPLSRQQFELFEIILPLYLANRRAPCIVAKIIADVACVNIFYHMLNRMGRTPHSITFNQDQIGDIQGRKISKLQAGIDTSNSAELDARSPFVPCAHDGPCHNQDHCSCAGDKVFCEWFCGCDHSCKRRFKGCSCSGVNKVCFNDSRCECWANHRECDPFLCKGCGVLEVLDSSNKYNEQIRKGRCKNNRLQLDLPARTIKAPSEVQGYGLFAGEDLEEYAYIGEYRGEIVSAAESDRRGAVYHILGAEYLFVINREQEMDASNVGNKMRFMNNSQKESNINVMARKMLCNGVQRVMLYAKRKIKAGDELLYNYNYPAAVTKKFWERGEKPSSATGAIIALGPKTTTPASAQPRINGRFAKKAQVEDDGNQFNDEDSSQSPLVNRAKRKREHDDARPAHSLVPAKIDSVTAQDLADLGSPLPVVEASDDSDYGEAGEETELQSMEDSEAEDEASSGTEVLPTPKPKPKAAKRKVGPRDRRLGGKAQAAAWKTRKKNMAGLKGFKKAKS